MNTSRVSIIARSNKADGAVIMRMQYTDSVSDIAEADIEMPTGFVDEAPVNEGDAILTVKKRSDIDININRFGSLVVAGSKAEDYSLDNNGNLWLRANI